MSDEYTDLVNKKYGNWVKRFNNALADDNNLDDEIIKLLVGEEVPFTQKELWKLVRSSFKSTLDCHGDDEVDLNWAHSFYKRFWGSIRAASRQKKQSIATKQLDHIKYKLDG